MFVAFASYCDNSHKNNFKLIDFCALCVYSLHLTCWPTCVWARPSFAGIPGDISPTIVWHHLPDLIFDAAIVGGGALASQDCWGQSWKQAQLVQEIRWLPSLLQLISDEVGVCAGHPTGHRVEDAVNAIHHSIQDPGGPGVGGGIGCPSQAYPCWNFVREWLSEDHRVESENCKRTVLVFSYYLGFYPWNFKSDTPSTSFESSPMAISWCEVWKSLFIRHLMKLMCFTKPPNQFPGVPQL